MQRGFDVTVARRITGTDLRKRMKRGQKAVLVDTRSSIDGEVLDGAVNVPPELVEYWAPKVPKSAFIVAYCTCDDDGLAIEAVLALQRLGYRNAYVLEGGLAAARRAGVPAGRLAQ